MMSLADVLSVTGATRLRGGVSGQIAGVSTDTRTLRPGELFVALVGERMDGHDFVAEAFRHGACAALVSRTPDVPTDGCVLLVEDTLAALGRLAAAWRARFDVHVVAITGSVGKTTTKEMTASILARQGAVLKTAVNFNNEIGVPLTLLQLRAEHVAAVTELGMRGRGQIRYLAEIVSPTVGVITNVGISHMELLGSARAIAEAKGELLEVMSGTGVAVLNCESAHFDSLRSRANAAVTFGIDSGDVRAADVRAEAGSVHFRLWLPDGLELVASGEPVSPGGQWLEVTMPAPGRHNVSNALAAAAAAACAGATAAQIVAGLSSLEAVPGRMRILQAPGGFTVVDDAYNASPDSMRAALAVLCELNAGRRVAVLGEMRELGAGEQGLHRALGRDAAAAQLSLLVTVGELGREIAAGAAEVGPPTDMISVADGQEALAVLHDRVRPGDVVLVKASRALGLESVVEGLMRPHADDAHTAAPEA